MVMMVRAVCTALIAGAVAGAIFADLRFAVPGRTSEYRHARLKNWLATGCVYVLYYQARYSAAVVNTEQVRRALGVQPSGYGGILIAGFWAYALSTAINGAVVDRIGGRRGLLVGCVGCGTACLVCSKVSPGNHLLNGL